jgi:hypothetical protein
MLKTIALLHSVCTFLIAQFSYSFASQQYPPTTASVFPSFGPSSGGTVSKVLGFDFLEGTTVCRYGESAMGKATFSSSTEILCTSPSVSVVNGPVDFAVSNDGGGEFDTSGIRFMYHKPCTHSSQHVITIITPDCSCKGHLRNLIRCLIKFFHNCASAIMVYCKNHHGGFERRFRYQIFLFLRVVTLSPQPVRNTLVR